MSTSIDSDLFTKPFLLTKSFYRDVYPAIDPSNPELDVSGKVVVIIGAGGGLGNSIAIAWAKARASGIVLVGRSKETLDLTAKNVTDTSTATRVVEVVADTTSEQDVENLFVEIQTSFGIAHVLINTAGTVNGGAEIGKISPSQWWRDFESNFKGFYFISHFFINKFQGEGTIINLSTVGASMLNPGMSSYTIAKLAAIKLAEYIDTEHPKIRAFSLHPGIVRADDRGTVLPAFLPFSKDTQALAGGVTLYLASSKADYLRGGFVNANWDFPELEKHKEEITAEKLTKLAFLNAKLGPEGHPWNSP